MNRMVLSQQSRTAALQIEVRAIDYFQVGQRLRAHGMGIGLLRAALYNYEKGEGPVKLETLERIAVMRDVLAEAAA